eukprot:Clim_evm2s182 gene=Clim_evmTU2s182
MLVTKFRRPHFRSMIFQHLRPLLLAVLLLITFVVSRHTFFSSTSNALFVIYSRPSDWWWREVARQTWIKEFACASNLRGHQRSRCNYIFVIEQGDYVQLSGLEEATLAHEVERYGDISNGFASSPEGSLFDQLQAPQSGLIESLLYVSSIPQSIPVVLISMPIKAWPVAKNLQALLRKMPRDAVLFSSALVGPNAPSLYAIRGNEHIIVLGSEATRKFQREIIDDNRNSTGRVFNLSDQIDARDIKMVAIDLDIAHAIDLDSHALLAPCQSPNGTISSNNPGQLNASLSSFGEPVFLADCAVQELPVLASMPGNADFAEYHLAVSEIWRTGIGNAYQRKALETMLSRAELSRTLFDIALGDIDKRRIQHDLKPHIMSNSQWWNNHKASKKNQRMFLIGNAPSLNHLPLWMLEGEDALVFNRFYLMQERFYSWTPSHYMCIDSWVCPDVSPDINWYRQYVGDAFFPYDRKDYNYWSDIIPGNNAHWFWFSQKHQLYKPVDDRPDVIYQPQTGTLGTVASTGLEVLGFLGYQDVNIIGVDMNYKNFSDDKRKKLGIKWVSGDEDQDHFDPRYFSKGRKLKAPDVKNVMLPSIHEAVKMVKEAYGTTTEFHNAGYKGNLDVFERVQFDSLFKDVSREELKRRFMRQLNPTYTMEIDFDGESLQEMFPGATVAESVNYMNFVDYAIMEATAAADNMQQLLKNFIPHGPYEGYTLFVRRPEMPKYVDMAQPPPTH